MTQVPRRVRAGLALMTGFVALATAAALAAPRSARADEVVTKIAIAAPRAKVWAALTDFASYPSWNPFIRRLEGKVAVGGTVTADLHTTNLKPRTVQAKILIVDPEKQLRWLGRLPGLFSGEHYWILADRADGGTDLTQGESFKGVMVPLIKPERLRVDYEAMNMAMKARVETAR